MYCWISVQQHITDREKCYLWQLNTSVWNQYRVQRHSEHIAAFTICTNVAPVTLYPLTNQLYTGKSIEALPVPADSILLLPSVYFWQRYSNPNFQNASLSLSLSFSPSQFLSLNDRYQYISQSLSTLDYIL